MSTNQKKPEAIVFSVTPADDAHGAQVIFSLTSDGAVCLLDGESAKPENFLKKYSIVREKSRVKKGIVYLEENLPLFAVPLTKFFSQATGVEVVELATYEVGSILPVRVSYSVSRKGDKFTLSVRSDLTSATGDALHEERKELDKMEGDLKFNPSGGVSPKRKSLRF